MMTPARSLVRLMTLSIALVAAVLASPPDALAGGAPTHGPSRSAFEAFVIDGLPELVVGKEFDWKGHHYEVLRVHSITRTHVQRTRPSDVNNDVAAQGWTLALLHVKVDGRLSRVRVEGNARYMNSPNGWEWDRVLMYLGLNDSYDFVTEATDR
jgi:hypothetical protein